MADEVIVFDAAGSMPDGSDPGAPTNSPLSIGPGTSYPISEASFPAPPLNVQSSSSVDTEGELPVSRRHGNRTITLKIEMDESGANNTLLDALQVKFAKLARDGGTIKRTRKDGSTFRIYDIVAADGWDPVYDLKYLLGHSSEVVMTLPAKPYARGAEVDLGDNVETTLPALVFTEASIPGDVDALGRLVIDNDVATDQWWVVWGLESRNYSSSANASLFYEAEGRTAMGGSAIAVGPSGASGAGSNVMRNTALSTSYLAVLSTQATGAGAHLSHIGTFRVFARVQTPTTNTGTVSVALEWGEGDFRRYTRNPATSIPVEWGGAWRLLDLGMVTLTRTASGTQRWEGRVVAKSTVAGDDIDMDCLFLVPVAEGSGEISAVLRTDTPSVFTARDEFDQAVGALTGKTLPTGGTWSGAGGGAGDFSVVSGAIARRTSTADPFTSTFAGRFERSGVGTLTNGVVQADMRISAAVATTGQGVFARYTDTSNLLFAYLSLTGSERAVAVRKVIAGTDTLIGTAVAASPFAVNVWYTVRLYFDVVGRWAVSVSQTGSPAVLASASGQDSSLATGGTLATGGFGIYDWNPASGAANRDYDNYFAFAPASDAAIFASQSVEVRHDRVVREDSGGTLWQTPSSYEGDYLRVPPSGAEARTTRVIVKASRFGLGALGDPAIDDISARLFVTPRYL